MHSSCVSHLLSLNDIHYMVLDGANKCVRTQNHVGGRHRDGLSALYVPGQLTN